MRQFRAFATLADQQLKQKSFWIFLILFVLIGPVLVILHSETNLVEREMRPLLSESATVDHFDTGVSATGFAGGYSGSATRLFRDPASEPPTEFPISPAFAAGWQLMPRSNSIGRSPWSFPVIGSLSDFYRSLLPILMMVTGILAFPARRRLASLRALLPCARWGCYLMITGALTLQIIMIAVLAGASTWLSLTLTQGATSSTAWFVTEYFSTIIVYGFGFAMLGTVLAELVRNRPIALLIGLVLLIGVWEYVSPLPVRVYGSLVESTTGMSPSQLNLNPAYGITRILLYPPQFAFDSIGLSIAKLASRVEDPYVARSEIQRGLLRLWAGLVAFASGWFVIGWLAFPRVVRMNS